MKQRIKTCVLCDTKIQPYHASCLKCLSTYLKYKNTVWMKDLISAQEKQFQIDKKECETLDKIPSIYKEVLQRGRNIYTDSVISLSKQNKTPYQIAKELRISKRTVESILYRYRKSKNTANILI